MVATGRVSAARLVCDLEMNLEGETGAEAQAKRREARKRRKYLLKLADKRGDTPLHAAAATGNKDCVRLLLKSGGNINIVNQTGLIPEELARLNGHRSVWKMLVRYRKWLEGQAQPGGGEERSGAVEEDGVETMELTLGSPAGSSRPSSSHAWEIDTPATPGVKGSFPGEQGMDEEDKEWNAMEGVAEEGGKAASPEAEGKAANPNLAYDIAGDGSEEAEANRRRLARMAASESNTDAGYGASYRSDGLMTSSRGDEGYGSHRPSLFTPIASSRGDGYTYDETGNGHHTQRQLFTDYGASQVPVHSPMTGPHHHHHHDGYSDHAAAAAEQDSTSPYYDRDRFRSSFQTNSRVMNMMKKTTAGKKEKKSATNQRRRRHMAMEGGGRRLRSRAVNKGNKASASSSKSKKEAKKERQRALAEERQRLAEAVAANAAAAAAASMPAPSEAAAAPAAATAAPAALRAVMPPLMSNPVPADAPSPTEEQTPSFPDASEAATTEAAAAPPTAATATTTATTAAPSSTAAAALKPAAAAAAAPAMKSPSLKGAVLTSPIASSTLRRGSLGGTQRLLGSDSVVVQPKEFSPVGLQTPPKPRRDSATAAQSLSSALHEAVATTARQLHADSEEPSPPQPRPPGAMKEKLRQTARRVNMVLKSTFLGKTSGGKEKTEEAAPYSTPLPSKKSQLVSTHQKKQMKQRQQQEENERFHATGKEGMMFTFSLTAGHESMMSKTSSPEGASASFSANSEATAAPKIDIVSSLSVVGKKMESPEKKDKSSHSREESAEAGKKDKKKKKDKGKHGGGRRGSTREVRDGWRRYLDKGSGCHYYVHTDGTTQWEPPAAWADEGNGSTATAAAASKGPALPPGWIQHTDPGTGIPYYYNKDTG